ncbi:MAG: sensor histidine kinase [Pirellulaceae bacterium]|nr:sensor histidine kinase [Pirellulaceae bacterium]
MSNDERLDRLRTRIAELESHFAALAADVDDREKLRRLLDLQEKERRWAAFEIHDGVVQDITSALMFVEAAAHGMGDREPDADENLQKAIRLLRDGLAEARALINGLRPPILEEHGLLPALGNLAFEVSSATQAEIELKAPDELPELENAVETTVYRIVQECVTNAWRHGRAKVVTIALRCREGSLQVGVSDDGSGFDPESVTPNRHGLTGILERAELLGGSAEIQSSPGNGASISAEIPLADND